MAISQNFSSLNPSFSIDFSKSKRLDSRISFTRVQSGTTTSTYTGADGLIKYASANIPRFDHELDTTDSTVKCRGLLIESARTNLFLQSVSPDNTLTPANWAKGVNTTRVGLTTSPDGTNNAVIYQGNGSPSNDFVTQSVALGANTTYTVSIWVKLISGTLPTSGNILASDYNNGTSTVRMNLSYIGLTTSWKRFSVTFTNVTAGSYAQYFITDKNTTAQVAIWGPQIEASGFMTSYIPTTTSTVTRSADNVVVSGTNFSSWYGQTEGTYIATIRNVKQQLSGIFTRLVELRGTPTGENYAILVMSPNSLTMYPEMRANNTNTLTTFTTTPTNNVFKIGTGLQVNNVSFYNLGTNFGTDTSVTIPIVNTLYLGHNLIGGDQINGHMSQFIYYPRRLTDTQLQTLSR